MLKWPLLLFVGAAAAGAMGHSDIAAGVGKAAVVLFFFLVAISALSYLTSGRTTPYGLLGGLASIALIVTAAGLGVWLSDRYSLETLGAELDARLSAARATFAVHADGAAAQADESRLYASTQESPAAVRGRRQSLVAALAAAEDRD